VFVDDSHFTNPDMSQELERPGSPPRQQRPTRSPARLSLDNFEFEPIASPPRASQAGQPQASSQRRRQTSSINKVLTSPRSLELCEKYGIDAAELVYRPEHAFGGGGVTKAIAARRHERHEAKRQQKLTFLRDARATAIQQEAELAAALEEAGLDESAASPAAVRQLSPRSFVSNQSESAMRNRELQSANLEFVTLNREARAEAVTAKVSRATAAAEANRARHYSGVSERGTQRWGSVQQTLRNAAALNMGRKLSAEEQQSARDNYTAALVDGVTMRRDEDTLRQASEREQRIAHVGRRSTSASATRQAKADGNWARVQQETERCDYQKALGLDGRRIAGVQHNIVVMDAGLKSQARFEDRQSSVLGKVLTAEERAAEVRAELVAQTALDLDRVARNNAERAGDVTHREQQTTARRKEAAARFVADNQGAFEARQSGRVEEKVWEQELVRERVTDHTEEVRRVKKAKDYERKSRIYGSIVAKHGAI
jgi:hypothetical protein